MRHKVWGAIRVENSRREHFTITHSAMDAELATRDAGWHSHGRIAPTGEARGRPERLDVKTRL